ncbi:MAG: response regulator [Acidobacteria bacterium]|nr:response regulator [Acidobacteriota bacterium]
MAKILIVDDSSFQRRLVRGLLTRLGHEVIEADSGASGLVMLQKGQPELMLVDLLMPELTGYEVLEKLQQQACSIPRVVLTADVQETAKQQCLELGAFRVLNKPPKEELLRETINLALAEGGR